MAPLVLRPSTLLAFVAAGGAAATGSASETTTATTTTATRPMCQGDRYSFDAGYGDCSNYEEGYGPNHFYCDEDSNGTFVAQQVCPECGSCDMEAVQTEECRGDRSAFDAGHGGCEQYARQHNHNWAFCHVDADNGTRLLARQVCSECQRCHMAPASGDAPPSSGGGLEPGSAAAVGGALLLLLVLGASGGALTLRSRQRRRSSDSNNNANAVFTGDNSGAPAAADGLAGERRVEWDLDQGLRSSFRSADQGVVDAEQGRRAEEVNRIEQSNGFMGIASNPSFA